MLRIFFVIGRDTFSQRYQEIYIFVLGRVMHDDLFFSRTSVAKYQVAARFDREYREYA